MIADPVTADKYYGSVVERYDAERCHNLRWAREQLAVNDFVSEGPVLDVPLGTGRYGEIYRAKGLRVTGIDISPDMIAMARRRYPTIEAREGSILALPFPDDAFATAVCTRLLDWLAPDEMARAIAELRRAARALVVTIRTGVPRIAVNYTHDLSRFYAEIDGLFIAERRVTEVTGDDVEEIFLLRVPIWDDVVRQFPSCDRLFVDPDDEIQRLADQWAGRMWRHSVKVSRETATIRAEYWEAARLGALIDKMSAIDDRYTTDQPPRFMPGPATILRIGEYEAVLDGRRRINQWRAGSGRHPVLVIEA